MVANFKDLLERIFVLDPDKRITVVQALSHPFITGKWIMMLIFWLHKCYWACFYLVIYFLSSPSNFSPFMCLIYETMDLEHWVGLLDVDEAWKRWSIWNLPTWQFLSVVFCFL